MLYNISKDNWKRCKICKEEVSNLAKKYGGSGIYYTQVFKKHINKDHNTTLEKYFEYNCKLNRPICKCDICGQKVNITIKSSSFFWRQYKCGRNPGQQKWSIQAKRTRKGSGNPMYGKPAWNKGLNIETSDIIANMAKKAKGKKIPKKSRKKMSIAAKNRKVHGHTGYKHSKEAKEKCRQATLQRIKNGEFKQTKTKPHNKIANILRELKIQFEEEKIIDCWSFDFYLNEYNVFIEVDGDYFHTNPKIYPHGPQTNTQRINAYRDCKKNKFCKDNKMKLYRFWESDILNDVRKIKCKLKELLQ